MDTRWCTHYFYNYLLSKNIFNQFLINEDDKPVFQYMKNVQKQGSWQAFRLMQMLASFFEKSGAQPEPGKPLGEKLG